MAVIGVWTLLVIFSTSTWLETPRRPNGSHLFCPCALKMANGAFFTEFYMCCLRSPASLIFDWERTEELDIHTLKTYSQHISTLAWSEAAPQAVTIATTKDYRAPEEQFITNRNAGWQLSWWYVAFYKSWLYFSTRPGESNQARFTSYVETYTLSNNTHAIATATVSSTTSCSVILHLRQPFYLPGDKSKCENGTFSS